MKVCFFLFSFSLLCACAVRKTEYPASQREVVLPLLTADDGRPFVLQQRLRGQHGERELDAQVVLQFQEGVLRLVGLTPFGSRAFLVEQRGRAVHVESSLGRELPFDPRHVLLDVHRVLFSGPLSGLPDGVHLREENGVQVRENVEGGHLVERRFVREGDESHPVVITFSGARGPVTAQRVRLVNEGLGYTLHIETLSQQWL